VRREEAAAFMACAYAKYTGKLWLRGEPNREEIALTIVEDKVRELV
jgi:hypothetical protein